ncbi:MAG TPA: methyltransferase domain-containing protein [Vicinamibacterales bacterium]|jgi:SAM-dependent methyltransferase|nr:methyltransferase domain-containing protein [Vicinamibacterales bacterium]
MSGSDRDRAVDYYDSIAWRYDADLSANAIDRLARRAFIDLVTRYVDKRATLVDFGCGTGLDAASYARHGYRVLAWDASPGMLAELRRRCADDIEAGRVVAGSSDTDFSVQLDAWPPAQALTADFAVLNMIRDPAAIFALAARHLASPGWVIVSVLNPVTWRDLVRPRWWLSRARASAGTFANRTDRFDSYLHLVAAIARAAPQFRLIGLGTAGTFAKYDEVGGDAPLHVFWDEPDAKSLKRAMWRSPLSRLFGTFLFLVLRRDA